VDTHFNTIISNQTLSTASVQQLIESGFVIIPGPVERLSDLTVMYDDVMNSGTGTDFKIASTTIRMYDLVNRGAAFDDVYIQPPLLEACRHAIGEPFKLSSLLRRTLRPDSPAQELHVDLPRDSADAPNGRIHSYDRSLTPENGATRFVPTSQNWPDVPSERLTHTRSTVPGEVTACGDAGSVIVFDGAIWHGHMANKTSQKRRSIQGYFVRRTAQSGMDFSARMQPETRGRVCALARYLLSL